VFADAPASRKNHRERILPLPEDVGEALIDYPQRVWTL